MAAEAHVTRKATWRVEWKCSAHPTQFKLFSQSTEYPSKALASYEACLQRHGCIEARIVRRMVRTETTYEVVEPATLQGRI